MTAAVHAKGASLARVVEIVSPQRDWQVLDVATGTGDIMFEALKKLPGLTAVGVDFARPRVGRGLACADFDRDGDVDLLLTTNNGPPVLLRNDQVSGNPRRVQARYGAVMACADRIRALKGGSDG